MYKRQKGIVPFVSQILGLFILVYPTFSILFYAIPKLFRSNGIETLAILSATALLLFFPLSLGWLILLLFPRIKVFEDGIGFMTSPVTTKKIIWGEISFLHEFGNGYGALVIPSENRKLININKIYGLATGIIDPIILLTPDTIAHIRRVSQRSF